MTTPPAPEPGRPGQSGEPERFGPPGEPGADRSAHEPEGPPPGPGSDEPPPHSRQPPPDEPLPQYPTPPPLPPEAYPTYTGGSGYDYGGYGAPPVRRRNGMGVAALVLGIIGFLIGPASVLAIVFGRIGLNRAARGEATNRGMAQAGFVLGIVTLVLWILGLILVANHR